MNASRVKASGETSPRFTVEEVCTALGLPRSGASAEFHGVSTDTRTAQEGMLFFALRGERFDAHDFLADALSRGVRGIVVEAGRGPRSADAQVFEVADTTRALGALARFHRQRFSLPVVAVTGSNGKTTTKELLAAALGTVGPVLKTTGNLNNEVGVPLTLFGLRAEHRAAVVEMGMNHVGEIARLTDLALPTAGLITAVQPAHLEGLGDLETVARAKGELFRGLGTAAVAVVQGDDPRIRAQAQGIAARSFVYGQAPEADLIVESLSSGGGVVRHGGERYAFSLKLHGAHNALAAVGAIATAAALGVPLPPVVRALAAVEPAPRRLVLREGPVAVLDDCYNANPASMAAALEVGAELAQKRHGRLVAVLGDMLELGAESLRHHQELGKNASERATLAAFIGPHSLAASRVAQERLGENAAHFASAEAALPWVQGKLRPHDLVLVKASRGMHLETVVEALHPKVGG